MQRTGFLIQITHLECVSECVSVSVRMWGGEVSVWVCVGEDTVFLVMCPNVFLKYSFT